MKDNNSVKKDYTNRCKYLNSSFLDAYYDCYSQSIYFACLSRPQFKSITNESNIFKHKKYLRVIYHELRHYIDNIGTLWGQREITNIFNAYGAIKTNQTNHAKFIRDHNFLSKETSHDDKVEVYVENSLTTNWKYQIIVDDEIEGVFSPRVYLLFLDVHDSKICKAPISINSLLEANALYEELFIHQSANIDTDQFHRIIEDRNFQDEVITRTLYTSQNTIYSVAVHLVSNLLEISNFGSAIRVASEIATLSLNLPEELYKNLNFNFKGQEKELNFNLDKARDLGLIFLTLLQNYKEEYKQEGIYKIEDVLKSSNLPNLLSIEKLCETKIVAQQKSIFSSNPYIDFASKLLGKGLLAFKTFGLSGNKVPLFAGIKDNSLLPDFYFNDDEWEISNEDLVKKEISEIKNFEEYFSLCGQLFTKMTEYD